MGAARQRDGTFRSADEFARDLRGEAGAEEERRRRRVLPHRRALVATCSCSTTARYDKVRNYDGSWTEWGNTVRARSSDDGEASSERGPCNLGRAHYDSTPGGPWPEARASTAMARRQSPPDASSARSPRASGIDVVDILAKTAHARGEADDRRGG